MSNLRPRISGANRPAPSPTALAGLLRRSHEPTPFPLGTDLGNSDPNSRSHPATLHPHPLPIRGPRVSRLSPGRFSAAPSAFPTAPRSPPARLVPLAVRTTTALAQRNARPIFGLPPAPAGRLGCPGPPPPAGADSPRRLSAPGPLFAPTAASRRRSTLTAATAPHRRPAGPCPPADSRHRHPHRRMRRSALGLSPPARRRSVGPPCPPRQVAHRTPGPRRCRSTAPRGPPSGTPRAGPACALGPLRGLAAASLHETYPL